MSLKICTHHFIYFKNIFIFEQKACGHEKLLFIPPDPTPYQSVSYQLNLSLFDDRSVTSKNRTLKSGCVEHQHNSLRNSP